MGAPRSGTTLLQTLLDAHSACSIPPESHLFDHFGEIISCYGNLDQEDVLLRLARDLLKDERILRWQLNLKPEDLCRKVKERSFKGMISVLFETYACNHGKERWGDKTPEHTLHLDQILSIFPQARFVHLVRDGRDVAESLGRAFFGPPTLDRRAMLWKTYVNAFETFRQKNSSLCLTVRYEELVKNPQEVLGRVLTFIGEEPVQISQEIPETALKKIYRGTDDGSHQSLDDRVTEKKIGLFREAMTRRDLEIFESIAGDELKRFGYGLETSGLEKMNSFEKLASFLVFQTRFFKKINHPDYIKDRLQYHLRKNILKWRGRV